MGKLTNNSHSLICKIDCKIGCISWYFTSISKNESKKSNFISLSTNWNFPSILYTHRPLLILLRLSKLTLHVVLLHLYGSSLYSVMPSTVQFNICWSISGEYLWKILYHWNQISDGKIFMKYLSFTFNSFNVWKKKTFSISHHNSYE